MAKSKRPEHRRPAPGGPERKRRLTLHYFAVRHGLGLAVAAIGKGPVRLAEECWWVEAIGGGRFLVRATRPGGVGCRVVLDARPAYCTCPRPCRRLATLLALRGRGDI